MEKTSLIKTLVTTNGAIEGNCRITYQRDNNDKKPLTLIFENGKAVKAENVSFDLLFDKNFDLLDKYKPIGGKFSIKDLAAIRQSYEVTAIRGILGKLTGITSVRFDGNAGIENIEINGAKLHIDFETEAERKSLANGSTYTRNNPQNVKKLDASNNARKIIKDIEKCILYAYDDKGETMTDPKTKEKVPKPFKKGMKLKGTLTIGYGHTGRDVKAGMRITRQQADELLKKDMEIATHTIKKHVKVPLTQNEFDALTSFTYNIGEEQFRKSTMLSLINEGKYSEASNEFGRWTKSKGEVMGGLKIRRSKERELFRQV